VLPSQQGFRRTFKQTVNNAASKMFSVDESPPGVLGDLNNRSAAGEEDNGGDTKHARKNDPEGASQRAAGDQADIESRRAKEDAKTGDKRAMPKSRRHYHSMLIQEISSVMRHLNSSPPRKYTFDEWAWYLKLVGEDESNPETHRKAKGKPDLNDENLGTATGRKMDEDKKIKWSWVGSRSPLMGNREEAEWVLERLTKTLARELEAMRRDEEEGKGDWAEGGYMAGFGKARHMAEGEGKSRDKDKEGNDQSNPSSESSRTVTPEKDEAQAQKEFGKEKEQEQEKGE
jgi:potassium channel subfamily K, other eukaryote